MMANVARPEKEDRRSQQHARGSHGTKSGRSLSDADNGRFRPRLQRAQPFHLWVFSALLVAQGFTRADIELSAFDSLDNCVTCDDLAEGLEDRMASLETQGFDVTKSAFVVHSTGAIIVRRWILNRILYNRTVPATAKRLPSHFVSLAGANHGSTLD